MNSLDRFIERIIKWFFHLFNKDLSESTLKTMVQFVEFTLVGVTNSIISYTTNILIISLLKPYSVSWDYIAGNIGAFFISVLWSFYWNNKYVFSANGEKRNLWSALIKTYLTYAFTGLVLTNILSYLWVDVLGVSKYISPIINIIICLPVNFIINKVWAFRAQTEKQQGAKNEG